MECGQVFLISDMIRHGSSHICAQCKPVFMQKLAEGANIRTGMVYIGFWWRFAAATIDGIVLFLVNFVLGLVAGASMLQTMGVENQPFGALVVTQLLGLIVGVSYETILTGKYGATLGKMACKMKVVTADGGRVSYARALGRYFAKMLSGIILLIGYIMAAFDSEKRALHDRICNTRVVDAFSFKSGEIFK
jgi:uncharacterized RDD family membrane protein YckC